MIGIILMITAQLEEIPLSSLLPDVQKENAIAQVLQTLEANPDSLDLFRGYDQFLNEHPSLFLAEQSKFKMLPHTSYRNLANTFESQLFNSSSNKNNFMNYLYAANTDPDLSKSLDSLSRTKLQRQTSRDEFLQGIRYLQSNPNDAATFLNRPHLLQNQPQDLQPLRTLFRSEHSLQEILKDQFSTIQSSPASPAFIQPWWEQAYDNTTSIGSAYTQLESYLLKNPTRYWTWTRWTQAWADHPKAWGWTTFQHAEITKQLSDPNQYTQFLDSYFNQPEFREKLRSKWNQIEDKPNTFPPESDPPPIPTVTTKIPDQNKPESLRNTITQPTRPIDPRISAPNAPDRPAKPIKPESIEPTLSSP